MLPIIILAAGLANPTVGAMNSNVIDIQGTAEPDTTAVCASAGALIDSQGSLVGATSLRVSVMKSSPSLAGRYISVDVDCDKK